MARPDLNSPEGVDAYRRELRGVGKQMRLAAYAAVLVGAAVVISAIWLTVPGELLTAGYVAMGLGWILMIAAVFTRTRYHRRRMAESE